MNQVEPTRDDEWEREILDAVVRSADPSTLPSGGSFEEIALQGSFPKTTITVRVRLAGPPRVLDLGFRLWDDRGRPDYRGPDGDTEDPSSAATVILANVMEDAARRHRPRQL